MKEDKIECETCALRGYSPDFCKFHQKKIKEVDVKNCLPQKYYKSIRKKAVLGAGVGVMAATVGIAAVPAIGLKAVIGHALVAKLTAGSGAAGAGLNVARGDKKNHREAKGDKNSSVLLPLYLKKGS